MKGNLLGESSSLSDVTFFHAPLHLVKFFSFAIAQNIVNKGICTL